MEITTKYNVGDKFWAINEGKAIEFTVARIMLFVDTDTRISYAAKELSYSSSDFKEQNTFLSREELIDSL